MDADADADAGRRTRPGLNGHRGAVAASTSARHRKKFHWMGTGGYCLDTDDQRSCLWRAALVGVLHGDMRLRSRTVHAEAILDLDDSSTIGCWVTVVAALMGATAVVDGSDRTACSWHVDVTEPGPAVIAAAAELLCIREQTPPLCFEGHSHWPCRRCYV